MRISRPVAEILTVAILAISACGGAELYARTRGAETPMGARRDTVYLLPLPSMQIAYLTQEERLMVTAGQRAPILCAITLLAVAMRRRMRRR